jgi:hypothetical protein
MDLPIAFQACAKSTIGRSLQKIKQSNEDLQIMTEGKEAREKAKVEGRGGESRDIKNVMQTNGFWLLNRSRDNSGRGMTNSHK